MKQHLLEILLMCGAAIGAKAAIIPEALLSFPIRTEHVEYDNLRLLRALSSYDALRQKYSGNSLDDAKRAMARLGIQEDQVDEIVTGESTGSLYGLASGTFSGDLAAHKAKSARSAIKLLDSDAFCPSGPTCIIFLENSLAAFGLKDQLLQMLEARRGSAVRLSSNRQIVELMNDSDAHASIRGVLYGAQLKAAISGSMPDLNGWIKDWSPLLDKISAASYSVKLDTKAHVSGSLACTSPTAATVIYQTLNAASHLTPGSIAGGMPIQDLRVSSSGNVVSFTGVAPLPSGSPVNRVML